MTEFQLTFLLLSALCLGVLALAGATLARLRGSVRLDLELGGQTLARALAERDQARALAEQTRAELSASTQALQGVTALRHSTVTEPLGSDAKVSVSLNGGPLVPVPQEKKDSTNGN